VRGQERSHHVDPWPPEDGVIGELDVKNAKLRDDIEWISEAWKLNRAGGTSFISVESVEK